MATLLCCHEQVKAFCIRQTNFQRRDQVRMITVELPRLMEELFPGREISIGIDCISVANSATSRNPSGKTQRIKRLIPQSRSEGKSVRAGRNLYTEELHQQPKKQAVSRADGSRVWTRRLCGSFDYVDLANILLLSFPPRNQLQAQTLIIPLAKIYHSTFFTTFLKIRMILKVPTLRHSPLKKIALVQDIGLNVTN